MSKKLIFTVEFTIDDANISADELASSQIAIKNEVESCLVGNKMSTEMWRYGTFADAEVVSMELKEKHDTRQ
jgi:hypothetical protein